MITLARAIRRIGIMPSTYVKNDKGVETRVQNFDAAERTPERIAFHTDNMRVASKMMRKERKVQKPAKKHRRPRNRPHKDSSKK